MTVTQRRVRSDPNKEGGILTEPGMKYTCDSCGIDITLTVRIRCAAKECEEVDLCPSCFCEGKEPQKHKAWHDYKVVEQHSQPIFVPDWGADEELLLISGLIANGLGNWAEVASHVGTRTKEDCQAHYEEVFLGVKDDEINGASGQEEVMQVDGVTGKRKRPFMPPMDLNLDYDPEEFQVNKKARIEEMRKPQALPTGSSNPLVSAPTNHEVAGYMPGRLEFEHEVDNDAEMAVKDFEFALVYGYGGDQQPEATITRPPNENEDEDDDEDDDDESKSGQANGKVKEEDILIKAEPSDEPIEAGPSGPQSPTKNGKGKEKAEEPPLEFEDEDELEVKLALLDIYFSKLDKRDEAKDLIFDRVLTDYKKANERRKPREEKDLISRYKVFAKLQTAQDFEVLIEGLIYEQNLRKRIAELQEYRRMGITTAAEAEVYDTAKAARAGYRPLPARERLTDVLPSGARVNAGQHRFLHGTVGTPPSGITSKGDSREPTPRIPAASRRPPTPLNLSNAASLDLLSLEEQVLCSQIRVLPKPYLAIKEMFLRENERRKGLLKRRDARRMLHIDVLKSGKIFDFLVTAGMLILSYDPTVKTMPPPSKDPAMRFGKPPLSFDLTNGHHGSNGHIPSVQSVFLG